jgi:hypothetical protein
MPLSEVANPLPDDPVVTRECRGRFRELAEQLRARPDNVLSFVGNRVVAQVRMPFAEASDDQAVIRRPDVESWQHLPAPSLERRLQIARALGNLGGIGSKLGVASRSL